MAVPGKDTGTEKKEDLIKPVIKNDEEIGTGGGIFVLDLSRMKEFNLKLKPATSTSDRQNKEKEDKFETGSGDGVFINESEKDNKAAQSKTDVSYIPKSDEGHDISDVHKVGTGGGIFIQDVTIPGQQDDYFQHTKESTGLGQKYTDYEIATAGGVFIKESQSVEGERELINLTLPDLTEGTDASPEVPSGSNADFAFNILRLNPADIAQTITSTVMTVLAEINNSINNNPAGKNWPVELVGRANAMIDTKAKIAKRMVKEVGNFATGTIHNVDSLAAAVKLIAALNKN